MALRWVASKGPVPVPAPELVPVPVPVLEPALVPALVPAASAAPALRGPPLLRSCGCSRHKHRRKLRRRHRLKARLL